MHVEPWATKGKTQVTARPGQSQSLSAASELGADCGFWFANCMTSLVVHRISILTSLCRACVELVSSFVKRMGVARNPLCTCWSEEWDTK